VLVATDAEECRPAGGHRSGELGMPSRADQQVEKPCPKHAGVRARFLSATAPGPTHVEQ